MSDKLTPEQEAKCRAVADHFRTLLNPRTEETRLRVTDKLKAGLEMIYRQYNLPLPEIEILPSVQAAMDRAAELGPQGSFQSDLTGATPDRVGACSASWCAHYYAFIAMGEVKAEEEPDLIKFKDFLFEGVYETILLDERALVIEYPRVLLLDNDGNPHCADGPAVIWWNEEKLWFWHGVKVPREIIEDPEIFDRDAILAISNTEHRRVLQERLGVLLPTEALLQHPAMKDRWTDETTLLTYELLDCGDIGGESMLLLKKQSPVLQLGTQPTYVERVAPGLLNAQAARKWQSVARFYDDTELAVQKCNEDPSLSYGVET